MAVPRTSVAASALVGLLAVAPASADQRDAASVERAATSLRRALPTSIGDRLGCVNVVTSRTGRARRIRVFATDGAAVRAARRTLRRRDLAKIADVRLAAPNQAVVRRRELVERVTASRPFLPGPQGAEVRVHEHHSGSGTLALRRCPAVQILLISRATEFEAWAREQVARYGPKRVALVDVRGPVPG